MAITIAANISSLQAQRRLTAATDGLSKSYAKLSSGSRISSASDDAAGLAVADSLRAQTRISLVAMRNANDGISLLSIADGALEQIASILVRMSELATQARSETFTNALRSVLNEEFVACKSEIDRIVEVSVFNGINLISSTAASFSLQVGVDNSTSSTIVLTGVNSSTMLKAGLNLRNDTLRFSWSAELALQNLGQAVSNLASYRGSFGAVESRLVSAVRSLANSAHNFTAAESRIRDTDVAEESAQVLRLTILQQSAAAVLSQANQSPALALELLG